MSNSVTLSSTARSNLLALQNTASMIGRTQDRLSTGLAIKSPIDDAVKYFQAKSLSDRASDLTERKDSIDQGISTLESVLKATASIEKMVSQMKGIIDSTRSQSMAERTESKNQLLELAKQIQGLVEDTTYKGLNLLNSSTSKLTVRFSEKAASKLEVTGVDFNHATNAGALYKDAAGGALAVDTDGTADALTTVLGFTQADIALVDFTVAADLATFNGDADTVLANLDATISNVRATSASIANNASILRVRFDFTKDYVNVLQGGSDKLVLADLNEEGANMMALQTRQQLGIQALALAGQSEQSILALLR